MRKAAYPVNAWAWFIHLPTSSKTNSLNSRRRMNSWRNWKRRWAKNSKRPYAEMYLKSYLEISIFGFYSHLGFCCPWCGCNRRCLTLAFLSHDSPPSHCHHRCCGNGLRLRWKKPYSAIIKRGEKCYFGCNRKCDSRSSQYYSEAGLNINDASISLIMISLE